MAAVLAGKLSGRPGHAALAPGQGTVIKVKGESTAVYKDADGQVHAVSAICTHLGCTVGFNPSDATWDCPCHGSHFAPDGSVLNAPAVLPLRPAGR